MIKKMFFLRTSSPVPLAITTTSPTFSGTMSQILGFLGAKKLASTGVFTDDDLVDRLNHDYTSVVMVVLAVIISTRHYVGDQIQCWVPGYFTGTYVDYTGKVCTQGTIKHRYNHGLPPHGSKKIYSLI